MLYDRGRAKGPEPSSALVLYQEVGRHGVRRGYLQGLEDVAIYYQSWRPEGEIKAVLLVAHGYAEHSGRYQNLVNYFVPRGYAVYALDHRGHGRSGGERVFVKRFSDYVVDLKTCST